LPARLVHLGPCSVGDRSQLRLRKAPLAEHRAQIALARIGRLYFAAPDPKGGAVLHGPRLFAQPTCHHAPEVYGGLRENEAAKLLRGFFAPLLERGPRPVHPGSGFEAQQVLRDKRFLVKLALPGRFLFLFRLRFGLYAVLARLGAVADWGALESGWAAEARRP